MSKRPPFHRVDGPITDRLLTRTPAWMDDALCLDDPEAFFPESADRATIAHAKQVCAACPVRSDCADYALTNEEPFGIWGGLTEDERRHLLGKSPRPRKPSASPVCSVCGVTFKSAQSRATHETFKHRDGLAS